MSHTKPQSRIPWIGISLLALPLILIISLIIVFSCLYAPILTHRVRADLTRTYREVAQQLCTERPGPDFFAKRLPHGWITSSAKFGEMAPGDWGYREEGNDVLVWFRDKTKGQSGVWARKIPCEESINIPLVFFTGGSIIILAMIILTGAAIRLLLMNVRQADEFLAATAHDLKTPVVSLRRLIGRQDEVAKTVQKRLELIIRNLQSFIVGGATRVSPPLEPIAWRSLYEEAYQVFQNDFRAVWDGKDVALVVEPGVPEIIRTDSTLFVQIIWNLLGNAFKYAALEGPVTVRVASKDGAFTLSVVDEGPGLSPKELKRIFKRYYRGRAVGSKSGYGIGLATSRGFAQALKGDLTVRPNMPKGLVFTLTLPLAACAENGAFPK